MKLKKGSAAAKAYMAKIRGMKKVQKTEKPVSGYVKTVRKGSATNVLYTNTTTAKKTAKPRQNTLFGSGEIITLDQIGRQLNHYEFDLVQLAGEKRSAKTAIEKKRLAEVIKVKKAQFNALRAYLNTRAKFSHMR